MGRSGLSDELFCVAGHCIRERGDHLSFGRNWLKPQTMAWPGAAPDLSTVSAIISWSAAEGDRAISCGVVTSEE